MKEKIVAFLKKYKKPILIISALIILWLIIRASGKSEMKSDGSPESLARCLKESGAKFYGSKSCGYCVKQKAMFGNAAVDLPYIECTSSTQSCRDAKITGYPTWVFANGKRQSGAIPLETLRQLSGC